MAMELTRSGWHCYLKGVAKIIGPCGRVYKEEGTFVRCYEKGRREGIPQVS